jgi:hypothetical protein
MCHLHCCSVYLSHCFPKRSFPRVKHRSLLSSAYISLCPNRNQICIHYYRVIISKNFVCNIGCCSKILDQIGRIFQADANSKQTCWTRHTTWRLDTRSVLNQRLGTSLTCCSEYCCKGTRNSHPHCLRFKLNTEYTSILLLHLSAGYCMTWVRLQTRAVDAFHRYVFQ